MDLPAVLEICLDRIQSGVSANDCLASYPDYAEELRPLLGSAARLVELRRESMPSARRVATVAALRQAVVAPRVGQAPAGSYGRRWMASWRGRRPALALAGGVTALIVASSIWLVTSAAASGPGDWSYGVRVTAERLPMLIQFSPESRAGAALSVADRRLDDLVSYVRRDGKVDGRAVSALLTSDEAAWKAAASAPATTRATAAARMEEHAQGLRTLASELEPGPAAVTLEAAAAKVENLSREFKVQSLPPVVAPTTLPTLAVPTTAVVTPAADKGDRPSGKAPRIKSAAEMADAFAMEPKEPGAQRGHEREVPGKALGHSEASIPSAIPRQPSAVPTPTAGGDEIAGQPAGLPAAIPPPPARSEAQHSKNGNPPKGAKDKAGTASFHGQGRHKSDPPGQSGSAPGRSAGASQGPALRH